MTAARVAQEVRRTWDRVAFCWYWLRVFWCLGVLGFAVGFVLVADPVTTLTGVFQQ